jgi:GT2 family glycosyltransferase
VTLSVVIPFYAGRNGEHIPMLHECVASLQGHDELIIVSNHPTPDGRAEFSRWVNLGLRLARGDYRLVLNSDTKLLAGNLRDLCKPGVITSPAINGDPVQFHGCCFCVPASVYAEHGGLDEQFVGNFEDLDYALRMYRAAVPMENAPTVSIWHHGGATYQFLNQREMMGGDNLRLFVERWGRWVTLPELMAEDRAAGRVVEPRYP